MSRIQTGLKLNIKNCYMPWKMFLGLCFLVLQATTASAGNAIINKLDFASLSGDELQLQMEVIGAFVEPKVFHTDNPARIALDFPATQSGLDKKVFPVNLGVVSNVYVVEAGDRVRVVVNLVESVPFEIKMQGNKVIVSIKNAKSVAAAGQTNVYEQPDYLGNQENRDNVSSISGLIPKQSIKHLDFRRGTKGEGRLLISLTSPDTVVNTSEKGGKIILTFVNTELPSKLEKRMDVSDFATPVQMIDFRSIGSKTRVDVTMATSNYEYSSFQSEGLLTVEFRPLTAAEKAEREKNEFPYTGERLSLNFQSIPVRSVLQILADFTDLNIIASDSVGGSVTLRLDDVPWDQVLDLVLKSKGLSKRETGNVVLVAPTSEINKIEKEQLAAEKVVEQLEPLRTEYIQINYAKAENFRNLLQGATSIGSVSGCSVTTGASASSGGSTSRPLGSNNSGGSNRGREGRANDKFSLLSKRGTAIVDSRTNILIVRDTAKHLEDIRKLFKLLDVPVRQVLIESRIVSASTDFAKEIGVRFGVAKVAEVGSNKQFGLNGQGVGGVNDVVVDGTPGIDLPDLLTTGSTGTLGLTLIRAADYILNLELTALQDEGRGEVLSNPRVMTSDRCEASIRQGTQIAFESGDIQNRTVTLVDAVLELKVTPQITPNGSIIMDLNISRNSPGAQLTPTGQPPIDVQEVQTSVHVENGETLVVGGIYERIEAETLNKVPFFADLPGVGFLFKSTNKNDNKTELLIFVTPKVVNDKASIN